MTGIWAVRVLACLVLMAALGWTGVALAQGQDSTPGERYLRVMNEMLHVIWDNANQNYFDRRRQLDESDRHARINTRITRVSAPAFGDHVYLWINTVTGPKGEPRTSHRLATLTAGGREGVSDDVVLMRH